MIYTQLSHKKIILKLKLDFMTSCVIINSILDKSPPSYHIYNLDIIFIQNIISIVQNSTIKLHFLYICILGEIIDGL